MKQDTTKKLKKVLFVVTKSNFGGAQRYVYDLATNLPQDAFEVVVAFGTTGLPGGSAGKLSEMLTQAHIRTILIPELGRDVSLRSDIAACGALWRIFKEEHPDVVHLNSSKVGSLGALIARIARVPKIIFTAHGWPFLEDRKIFAILAISIMSWVTVLFSHATICVSECDRKNAWWMPFVQKKITVIHNGIGSVDFTERNTARSTLFPEDQRIAHSDDVWVITNAELHPNKNLFAGIDAVALYNKTHTDHPIFYSIMGSGEQYQELHTYIEVHHLSDSICLLGFIPDGKRYLQAFDIFFLPSKKEGLPYVLLEAGKAGLPVVASDVGGISEIVTSRTSGFLSVHTDIEGFVHNLTTLIEDEKLAERIGSALTERIARDFSFERMLRETISLY